MAPNAKSKCPACGRIRGHKEGCPNDVNTFRSGSNSKDPDGAKAAQTPSSAAQARDDVNHSAARDEAAARGTEAPPAGTFFPVVLKDGAIDDLQRSINEGDFAGDGQKQHQCEFEEPGSDGGAVRCTNFAAMKKVVKNHCPTCERDRKETLLRLCIPHAINCWGGNVPARLQVEMNFS